MTALILALLLKALVVLAVSKTVPGIRVKSFGTAVIVAIVYGLLAVVLGSFLKTLAFPLILVSLGLFTFVINAVLIWATNKLVSGFEVRGGRSLLLASVLMTLGMTAVDFGVAKLLGA